MNSPQNTLAKPIVRAERFLAPFRLRSLALCRVPSHVFISSAGWKSTTLSHSLRTDSQSLRISAFLVFNSKKNQKKNVSYSSHLPTCCGSSTSFKRLNIEIASYLDQKQPMFLKTTLIKHVSTFTSVISVYLINYFQKSPVC